MFERGVSPHMVGRAAELSALVSALGETDGGSSTVALLSGEAGIGKTRLTSEFVERARLSGMLTLVGRCLSLTGVSPPPYAPLAQAFRTRSPTLPAAHEDDLSALLPREPVVGARPTGVSAAGDADQQAGLFIRVASTLAELSQAATIVMVIEDVHWADRSTLDILAYVVHTLADDRFMLVVSYRDDEVERKPDLRAWLVQLRRTRRLLDVRLAPLGRTEIAAQIAGITGAEPADELLDAVCARVDGNPLFVEELIAGGPPPAGQLPPTLVDVITTRMEQLPQMTRRLLRSAAVVGRRTSDALLCAAAGIGTAELSEAIRPAISSHLLRIVSRDSTYEFHHELVREAAYQELLPGERARAHGAVAQWLTDHTSGSDPVDLAQVAYHWTEADDESHAIPALVAAGSAALQSAGFAEAFDLLARAVTWWLRAGWKATDEVAPGLDLLELARLATRAGNVAGDMASAHELGEAVLSRIEPETDPLRYGDLIAFHGVNRAASGDMFGARDLFEHALALLPADTPSRTKATLLFRYAFVSNAYLADFEAGRRLCEQSLGMARVLGDRGIERQALTNLGPIVAELGDADHGSVLLRRSIELASDGSEVDATVEAYIHLSHVAVRGRVDDSLEIAREGIATAQRLGVPLSRSAPLLAIAAEALFRAGDWDSAEQMFLDAIARTKMEVLKLDAAILLTPLLIARGDFARAAQTLPRPEDLAVWGPGWLPVLHAVSAEMAVWQGLADAAGLAVGAAAAALGPRVEPDVTAWLIATAERAVADMVQHGRTQRGSGVGPDNADALLRSWLGDQPRHPPASTLMMKGWLCQADAEYTRRKASDPECWQAAVEAWDDYGDKWRAAYARFRLAEALLAARGDRSAAVEPLRAAWWFADTAGANVLQRDIVALARRARVSLEPGESRRERSSTETKGLTSRELEVLHHIADGRSNAQIAAALFISEKTADAHVSSILRKLGAARRTEAAAIAHRLGMINQD